MTWTINPPLSAAVEPFAEGLDGLPVADVEGRPSCRRSSVLSNESIESIERDRFSVVVLRNSNSQILLVSDGNRTSLPVVTIPRWQRVAVHITERVFESWGLRTICLFQPETQSRFQHIGQDQYIVLEPRDATWQPPAGLAWVARAELSGTLHPSADLNSLDTILKQADSYNEGVLPGPFARAGWLDQLMSWVKDQIDSSDLRLTGEFRQFNCGPQFSLIRLETIGAALWFKAVGKPNLHELPITAIIARLFPSYVPTMVATHSSWNGWLTLEVPGSDLEEKSSNLLWSNTAKTLAALQLESVGKAGALLAAGCREMTNPVLLSRAKPLFAVMAELMEQQRMSPPQALNRQELHDLCEQVEEACCKLALLGIPDTLGHLDFNPGNIVNTPNRCVFLDWAEAYVGNPFLTFEYMREHLRQQYGGDLSRESEILANYCDPWNSSISPENLSEALLIAPLVAVFAYAVSCERWRTSEEVEDKRMAAYLRSLTRRIQREAMLFRDRTGRCQC
jgi:hypothetical protein